MNIVYSLKVSIFIGGYVQNATFVGLSPDSLRATFVKVCKYQEIVNNPVCGAIRTPGGEIVDFLFNTAYIPPCPNPVV
jgi:hypothetical protein